MVYNFLSSVAFQSHTHRANLTIAGAMSPAGPFENKFLRNPTTFNIYNKCGTIEERFVECIENIIMIFNNTGFCFTPLLITDLNFYQSSGIAAFDWCNRQNFI